jgi:hypothetical protein
MAQSGRSRQVPWLLANPASTAALLILLIVIALNVGAQAAERSRVGGFLRQGVLQLPALRLAGSGPSGLYLKRDDPVRVIDEDRASWDELSRLMHESPDELARVTVSWDIKRSGLWAMTRMEERWSLAWVWMGEPWSAEDQARGYAAVAEYIVGVQGWPTRFGALAHGPGERFTLLWGGYGINALTVALLVALAASLAWVPRVPAWIGAARRRLRQRPGHCRACGYELGGLEGDVCPECGRGLESTAMLQSDGGPHGKS